MPRSEFAGPRLRGHHSPGPITGAKIAVRISTSLWMSEPHFDELMGLLDRFPGTVDELAFFSHITHAPLLLDEHERRMQILARIMPVVRARGKSAGINLLTTIGHHEEHLAGSLDMPWQRFIAPDGRVCRGCYCPLDDHVQKYIRDLYRTTAQADPDFIWIDDDVRLYGHMPILCGCFCDLCVADFSEQTGTIWTRVGLVEALNGPRNSQSLSLRREWLTHNRRLIDTVLRLAEESAHAIRAGLPLGFMTGERFYEGYAFDMWADTLRGARNAPVIWRPGGGFYDDSKMAAMVDKAHEIGRQVGALPDQVIDIQAEIENFPYQVLRKGPHVTALEAATDIAAGTTGAAFNILAQTMESLDEWIPLLEKIAATRPFYDRVAANCCRTACEGLWFAWNQDAFMTAGGDDGWLGSSNPAGPDAGRTDIFSLGIPPAYTATGACVTALAGDSPLMFDRSTLECILAGGVVLDGPALARLVEMGLGEYLGFEPGDRYDDDTIEVFADHALNGPFPGHRRDCRQSFKWRWDGSVRALQPIHDQAEIVATLADYQDGDRGVSLGVFENELGGRVAVMGYFPWNLVQSRPRSVQTGSVMRWLSRHTIPAMVDTYARAHIWCRRRADGTPVIFVLNASCDPIPSLDLLVRTDVGSLLSYDMTDREKPLVRSGEFEGYGRFSLPDLGPWSAAIITSISSD